MRACDKREHSHFAQVMDKFVHNLEHMFLFLVDFACDLFLRSPVFFSLCEFHFGSICVECKFVFSPGSQTQMWDKSSLLWIHLSGHLAASDDIFPVVWLYRCFFLRTRVLLGCQVVDLVTCISHSVDLNATIAFCTLSLLVNDIFLLHIRVAVKRSFSA